MIQNMDIVWRAFEDAYVILLANLPRLLAALIVLLATMVAARWVADWARSALWRMKAPTNAIGPFSSIARISVLVLGSMVVLQVLGLSQAVFSAIASLGVVGLIVSFALQDITKQFACGVLLLLGRPFEIGDYIKVGAHEGRVVELQLRVTILRTDDGDEVLIPNADVYTSTLVNTSRAHARRYSVQLPLPAQADSEALRETLRTTIAAVPGVLAEPPTLVTYTKHDANVVALVAYYWIATANEQAPAVVSAVIAATNALRTDSAALS
jgi:small-conductance mechanosensitive channel